MSEREAPQPGLEEKLAKSESSGGTRPRATLAQLERLFGGVVVLESVKSKPVRVSTCPMDVTTVWRRVSGDVFEVEADQ